MSEELDDVKRQRRGAFSDVPSSARQIDLKSFPPKHPDVVAVLEKAARANPLLKNLERDERELLFRAMFEVKYNADDTIIRQGDQGDNFYIISEGECTVLGKLQSGVLFFPVLSLIVLQQ